MWFLDRLADIFASVGRGFTSAYEAVKNIPLLSSTFGSFFYWTAGFFSLASDYTYRLSDWADDISLQLRNAVSFDAILNRLYLYFPWLRDFAGNVREALRSFLDTYLPWWRDLFSEIRKNIERYLDTYLPWWRDPFDEIRKNIERFLDTYLPWWRDPELTFWDYVRNRLDIWLFDFLDLQADKLIDRVSRVLERLW